LFDTLTDEVGALIPFVITTVYFARGSLSMLQLQHIVEQEYIQPDMELVADRRLSPVAIARSKAAATAGGGGGRRSPLRRPSGPSVSPPSLRAASWGGSGNGRPSQSGAVQRKASDLDRPDLWPALCTSCLRFVLDLVDLNDENVESQAIDFAHPLIRAISFERYCNSEGAYDSAHGRLFAYFRRVVYQSSNGVWDGQSRLERLMSYKIAQRWERVYPAQRFDMSHNVSVAQVKKAAELVWKRATTAWVHHAFHSRELDMYIRTICDIQWVGIKCGLGQAYELLEDYQRALSLDPHERPLDAELVETITDLSEFVMRHAVILHQRPEMVYQAARNAPDSSRVALLSKEASISRHTWVSWHNKPQHSLDSQVLLAGLRMTDRAVAFSADGSLLASSPKEGVVTILNIAACRVVATINHGSSNVCMLCFHPLDWTIIICIYDDASRGVVWRTTDLTQLFSFRINQSGFSQERASVRSPARSPANAKPKDAWHQHVHWSEDGSHCIVATAAQVEYVDTVRWETATFKCNAGEVVSSCRLVVAQGACERPVMVCGMTSGRVILVAISDSRSGAPVTQDDQQGGAEDLAGVGSGSVNAARQASCDDHAVTFARTLALQVHDGPISFLAGVAPSGSPLVSKFLAVGSTNNSIAICNLENGTVQCRCHGHSGPILGLGFVPATDLLLSCSSDHTIRMWRPTMDGKRYSSWSEAVVLRGHGAAVLAIHAGSKAGDPMLSVSEDGSLRAWDLTASIASVERPGHTDSITCCTWCIRAGYLVIVSAAANGKVKCFDDNGKQEFWSVTVSSSDPSQKAVAAIAGVGRRIACAMFCVVKLLDVSNGAELFELQTDVWMNCVASHSPLDVPEEALGPLVAGGEKGCFKIWQVSEFMGQPPEVSLQRQQQQNSGDVMCCAVSTCGNLAASGSSDGCTRVYETSSKKLLHKMNSSMTSAILCVTFSPDSSVVAFSGIGPHISLWVLGENRGSFAIGGRMHIFETDLDTLPWCAFLKGGEYLVSAAKNRQVTLWQVHPATRSGLTVRCTDPPLAYVCSFVAASSFGSSDGMGGKGGVDNNRVVIGDQGGALYVLLFEDLGAY
jgi:WD40 repeat protein